MSDTGGGGAAPGLVAEECLLAEEVGLKEVVHLAQPVSLLLVHHRFATLDDEKVVALVALHSHPSPLSGISTNYLCKQMHYLAMLNAS